PTDASPGSERRRAMGRRSQRSRGCSRATSVACRHHNTRVTTRSPRSLTTKSARATKQKKKLTDDEGPTEPLPVERANVGRVDVGRALSPSSRAESPASVAFSKSRYRFTSGVRSGAVVTIRAEKG